jgi:hypothetical protein
MLKQFTKKNYAIEQTQHIQVYYKRIDISFKILYKYSKCLSKKHTNNKMQLKRLSLASFSLLFTSTVFVTFIFYLKSLIFFSILLFLDYFN